ncbi:ATP-binding protein [Pontiellaceae bacterium B12219]|nr:ATP-binding protein [Pontiellaceae bacterium B12219]
MSSTRKADGSRPLRQERYASDPAFNEGLKASTVARKCGVFSNPVHKELALHLQFISMQPGGLSVFVSDFLTRYGDRIGSKAMRRNLHIKTFNADQVRQVRDELGCAKDQFPLKGEWIGSLWEGPIQDNWEDDNDFEYRMDNWRKEKNREAANNPTSYPAQAIIDHCMDQAESWLEQWFIDFCLDPAVSLDFPPGWFHEIESSLTDYFNDRRIDTLAGKVVTSIGEEINDALDYAWEEKVLVHINGVARMGKTYQVKQWCNAHPGRVRYVQVPSGNDDISFLRAIARALGTASGSAMKTTQIKRQIEDAIQDSGIMLVFDEAHYLFPQYKDVRSSPRRINWLLTEVVNKGIPVAIITTPQFDMSQKAIVNGSGWADEQLTGRIAFRLDLPPVLPAEDLTDIAKHYFPEASKEVSGILSWYAHRSGKYLAGLEAVSKRARFLARKTGRSSPNGSDLKAAMTQVDPAIAEIFKQNKEPQKQIKQPAIEKPVYKPSARPVQATCEKTAVTA